MRINVLIVVGVGMMAGFGSAISTRLGFTGLQSFFLAGFAVGIAILAMAPTLALRSRVAELEAKIAATSSNTV